MKMNLPVTGRERDYDPERSIISVTDTRGIIRHVNDSFVEVSGFSREELLGHPHNMVRHPDMPPAAFASLWADAKQERPWIGVVKNRCKNGDHYWVSAHVLPVYSGDTLTGYQSVRSKPQPRHVKNAERLYGRLNRSRKPCTMWAQLGARWRMNATYLGLAMASTLVAAFGGAQVLGWLMPLTIVAIAVATHRLTSRLRRAATESRAIIDSPVARAVYGGQGDEVAQLETAVEMMRAHLRTTVDRIGEVSGTIIESAEQTAAAAEQTEQATVQQLQDTEQVARALAEMMATVGEVARSAASASDAVRSATELAESGHVIVHEVGGRIEHLAEAVNQAAAVIEALGQDSQNIGMVVAVIKEITEQTNLLALNAAIEAARAGDHGRGFAVVAGEVRTLASRTQRSADEIRELVVRLQDGAQQAVKAMAEGRQQAKGSVDEAKKAEESLEAITAAMGIVGDMNLQIASAMEQQEASASDISHKLSSIASVVGQSSAAAESTAEATHQLVALAHDLRSMVTHFRS